MMQSISNNIKVRADDFSTFAALINGINDCKYNSYKKLSEKKKTEYKNSSVRNEIFVNQP